MHRRHTLCQRLARPWVARAPRHRARPLCRHPGRGSDEKRPAGRADRSAHGFWSCARRASGRSLECAPPFSAGGTAMSLDRGGIERQRAGICAEPRQSLKDRTPSSALRPAVEAIVDRRVGAVLPRAIAPSRSRLQHMNDAADDAPIIPTLRPGQSGRQMRLKTLPLPIVQPKQSVTHSLAPRESTQHAEQRIT